MNIAQQIIETGKKNQLRINQLLHIALSESGMGQFVRAEEAMLLTFDDNSQLKFTDNEAIEVTA